MIKDTKKIETVSLSTKQISVLIAVFAAAFALRIYFARQIVNPGHGDLAYYLSLAENLASGQGFVIDYIWHFLTPWQTLTHYANDFWMPLTSVIISIFLIVLGKSLFVALMPSMIFGIGLAIVTFVWAMHYANSTRIAFWSAIICLFAPVLFKYSLATDSSIYYAVFASLVFLLLARAGQNPKLMLAAAIFAGLAQLSRQDGVLLMLTVLIMIIVMPNKKFLKAKLIFGSLVLYLAVLSPYFITNIIYTGKPFISKTFEIAFVRTHDDIYSYGKDLSLGGYLQWGWQNILASKGRAVYDNILTVLRSFGREAAVIPFLCLANLIFLKTANRRRYFIWPPIIFFALAFAFYTLIATYPAQGGALFRTALAIVPFAIILAVEFVIRFFKSRYLSSTILWLITLLAAAGCIRFSSLMVAGDRQINSDLHEIAEIILAEGDNKSEPVIMTRNPWEVNYTTGLRTVMIPNNDLATIYDVAIRYHANYLLLPAPREALQNIYDGTETDPRFRHWRDVPGSDYKLFMIVDIAKSQSTAKVAGT